MSGETIVVPTLPMLIVALPVAAVAAGTLTVAHGLKVLVDQRAAAARRAAERDRARRAEWQRYKAEQAAAMQDLKDQWQALCALQQRLVDTGLRPAAAGSGGDGKPATGFIAKRNDQDGHPARALLDEILRLLDGLPHSLLHDDAAPFGRLRAQAERWREPPAIRGAAGPELSSVRGLHTTVLRTIDSWRRTLEREEQGRRRLLERTEALLDEALYYRHLDERADSELEALVGRLQRLLARNEITPAALEWLEQRLAAVGPEAEQRVTRELVRPALQESVKHHLGNLGYRVLADFTTEDGSRPSRAMLRVPGGESVQAVIHPDGRMAFTLHHERETAADAPLSETELEHLRQQEAIWCRDLKTLVRQLVAEGWQCEIPFERPIPAGSIAVLESPADWDEEQRPAPRQRHRKHLT